MKQHAIYIVIMGIVFGAMTVLLNFFPRSTFSVLEKRDLAQRPEFSFSKLFSGDFTNNVNSWYSDTEPYRDLFMSTSMKVKDAQRISVSDDDVTFHANTDKVEAEPQPTDEEFEADQRNVGKYTNKLTANENAKIAHRGIIIIGKEPKARALMAYGGGPEGGVAYAEAANSYKRAFGDKVNVYCMVVPTAIDFYCPEKAKGKSREELPTINNIHAHLDPNVKAVDCYTALGRHAAEDIFLRTDHHWSPLGAYYAAEQFAKVAKVPFKTLLSYDRRVVHDFVGSMYGFSKDIAIKNSPEDFVYYVPRGVEYATYYINYKLDANWNVVGMSGEVKGEFFYKYKDGSGGAYCTFMGGDTRITRVETGTKNGRRVLILKDSFGNAIPGYLFFSFEEVHVVDNRYFTKNMTDYVNNHKITDILFANNIFSAYSPGVANKYVKFLTQKDGTTAPSPIPGKGKNAAKKPAAKSAEAKTEKAAADEQAAP